MKPGDGPATMFRFPNLSTAQEWSKKHDAMIYVELFGTVGVFQIYPGGRTIQYPADERHWRRLTTEAYFKEQERLFALREERRQKERSE